jgi:hypothetical protein
MPHRTMNYTAVMVALSCHTVPFPRNDKKLCFCISFSLIIVQSYRVWKKSDVKAKQDAKNLTWDRHEKTIPPVLNVNFCEI